MVFQFIFIWLISVHSAEPGEAQDFHLTPYAVASLGYGAIASDIDIHSEDYFGFQLYNGTGDAGVIGIRAGVEFFDRLSVYGEIQDWFWGVVLTDMEGPGGDSALIVDPTLIGLGLAYSFPLNPPFSIMSRVGTGYYTGSATLRVKDNIWEDAWEGEYAGNWGFNVSLGFGGTITKPEAFGRGFFMFEFTYHFVDMELEDTFTGAQPEPLKQNMGELKVCIGYSL